jgi:hypothetical protein
MQNTYLFTGEHKYWLMTHRDRIEPGVNYVLNRATIYRNRRDFLIQPGDTGRPEDYPAGPPAPGTGGLIACIMGSRAETETRFADTFGMTGRDALRADAPRPVCRHRQRAAP